ncbi:phenylalanine--tRNA ligase beta subunit-related protein [Rhodopseudomonas palustris]|uniref:B3/B4 tRNA-binding domain-containing protein n=1 Tax=Rhodopseudomonas palustris TaxID=1076 RepID=A0A418V1Z6_RHOPL|nr:phenylalanine--tRNA ligase beta subunit-related protein [Rhodopseudomonas palustris]RJF69945.1 hypothetical protein D4Q52_18625 [Rhodopseudomonas palustris]
MNKCEPVETSTDDLAQRGRQASYPLLAATPMFSEMYPGVYVRSARLRLGRSTSVLDLAEQWEALHRVWCGTGRSAIAQTPEIAAYRAFYRQIGLNVDRTPPSTQGLIQRYLAGEIIRPLPPLPAAVNLVNIVAVRTLVPLGAFDCGALAGDVRLDVAVEGERITPIGASSPIDIPAEVVVLRDDDKILSQFGYRDAHAQRVTEDTRELMLLACQVPGISDLLIRRALDEAITGLAQAFDAVPRAQT